MGTTDEYLIATKHTNVQIMCIILGMYFIYNDNK